MGVEADLVPDYEVVADGIPVSPENGESDHRRKANCLSWWHAGFSNDAVTGQATRCFPVRFGGNAVRRIPRGVVQSEFTPEAGATLKVV